MLEWVPPQKSKNIDILNNIINHLDLIDSIEEYTQLQNAHSFQAHVLLYIYRNRPYMGHKKSIDKFQQIRILHSMSFDHIGIVRNAFWTCFNFIKVTQGSFWTLTIYRIHRNLVKVYQDTCSDLISLRLLCLGAIY